MFLASQWLMGQGGLPTAAAMGKFAAWRIMKREVRMVGIYFSGSGNSRYAVELFCNEYDEAAKSIFYRGR